MKRFLMNDTATSKGRMEAAERMWSDQKMGKMQLDTGAGKHPLLPANWADPVVTEGKWNLHIVRPNTGTQRAGWSSIISHDCDLNGSPYWMLIEYHSRKTACMYCEEDMPAMIVGLFKLHNEHMIE